jgi:predicted nucleotidyltransferase component of viral defense system
MTFAIEQSIKEKIKVLAKEREATFAQLWRNLILERFLTRLARSRYKEKFVLKGGNLLAKYIHIGRETQDLDFFIRNLSNREKSLRTILQEICDIDADDSFLFEVAKIKILNHSQLAYTGAEITLQTLFGAAKTVIRMDLGFGDRVEPIEYSMDLIATSEGPIFESRISLHCYPREFIFAEKLETVVFRGGGNTRMKDFHDLYSLIHLGNLDASLAEKAVRLVFNHRKTPLKKLPIAFSKYSFAMLEKNWSNYGRKIKMKKNSLKLPESIQDVISVLNQWFEKNASYGFFRAE